MVQKYQPQQISLVLFDIDGTLYDKNKEYVTGSGSIQTAHDFFRFSAWDRLMRGNAPDDVAEELVEEYRDHIKKPGSLEQAIKSIPQESKEAYLAKVEEHGSNGKVFKNEFGTDSKYLHKQMLQHIRFSEVLAKDERLVNLFESLQAKGYGIGVITTETHKTVHDVAEALGFDPTIFYVDTDDDYHMLCSENVKDKKPSPEAFLRAIELYGRKGKEETVVYVGDHKNKDVFGSMNVGMQAVHVKNNGQEPNLETMDINGTAREYAEIGSVYDLEKVL